MDTLLKIGVIDPYDCKSRLAKAKNQLKWSTLQLIVRSPSGVLLVLFILFSQTLAQITFAGTFHFWLIPVLAKRGGDEILI
jgi:hypothetical protein